MLGITCDNWFRALSSYTYTTSLWRLTDQEPLTFPGMQSTSISFRPHGFLGMEGAGLRMGNGGKWWKMSLFHYWKFIFRPHHPPELGKKTTRMAQPESPFFAPRPLYCKRDICSFRQRYMPSSQDRSEVFPKCSDSAHVSPKFRN